MKWLEDIVDHVASKDAGREIVVSSGVSPSGAYHLGTLREIMTAEAVTRALKMRGLQAKHIHVSDDLDVFRKVPVDIPQDFEQYLGMPLCDMPSPNSAFSGSYADYYVADLKPVAEALKLDMEVIRAHEKYRAGFFETAIEKVLSNIQIIRQDLENISGRKLDEAWSPIQVVENGRLKNRKFLSIDTAKKTVTYENVEGNPVDISYDDGSVKLNWRIDWPARWWLLGVDVEPFGRDHATKGGSYDTGVALVRDVFSAEPPVPVPYNFINRAGDTKKMSKSKGDSVTATDLLETMPPEVLWFFMLKSSPDKLLFFDTAETLIRLFDDFSVLLSKTDRSTEEQALLDLCLHGIEMQTVSRVPFTHLYVSYQASLRDADKTMDVIRRTEYANVVDEDEAIIREELRFIDRWLDTWAPEDARFDLRNDAPTSDELTETQRTFLRELAIKITDAPLDADGEWFHKAIYDFKESLGLQPKELFVALYRTLIDKDSGPRAGWFLSTLPREWLVAQLKKSC